MNKKKLGFFSIVLLGINAIIGTGIFLLPNEAYSQLGTSVLFVIIFAAILVTCIALCFAEAAGMFQKNGGPYQYAKAAFGNFVGFEVGFMKIAVSCIAWATMANGFVEALAFFIPTATDFRIIIMLILIGGLGVINLLGVQSSKWVNNIITIAKLLPILFFIVIGIFFIKGSNFSPMLLDGVNPISGFGMATITIFYAFTGFESIAAAAADMDDVKKTLPRAIILSMVAVSAVYMLIFIVAIGILGPSLATTNAPIAEAAGTFLSWGKTFVGLGTIISVAGINIASSFLTPRNVVAMADDGLLPRQLSKYNKAGVPAASIIFSVIVTMMIAVSGGFIQLAAISVVSRFVAQYIPTCIAILVLRKKGYTSTFTVPLGPVIPVIAVIVSIWLLSQASLDKLVAGVIGFIVGVPIYFFMQWFSKQASQMKLDRKEDKA